MLHLCAGWLQVPPGPRASCHCLLVGSPGRYALIDTGIGLRDIADPEGRIGMQAITEAGFQFNAEDTAARLIQAHGIDLAEVTDLVLTHLDPDHAGGIADFPTAIVHVSAEEFTAAHSGDCRYRPCQWNHQPVWQAHKPSAERWFGFEARRIPCGLDVQVLLIPLFGHTLGHCGVAIGSQNGWVLHVGDAYYLRAELAEPEHPVGQLATLRAANNEQRLAALESIRALLRDHGPAVQVMGYHDTLELPEQCKQ